MCGARGRDKWACALEARLSLFLSVKQILSFSSQVFPALTLPMKRLQSTIASAAKLRGWERAEQMPWALGNLIN